MDYSKEFFESIEDRNREFNDLFYGADYGKGLQIKNIERMLKKFAVKEFVEALDYKWNEKKLAKYHKQQKISENNEYGTTFDSYIKFRDKKIVVYTCIIGKYDLLKEPVLSFDNVEYVCYTDNRENITVLENSKWTIRVIPCELLEKYDKILANRYIKMHPKEFFEDSDYTLYVDGNVKIVSYPGAYMPQTATKTGVAIFSHNARECAYGEAKVCIARKKGDKDAIVKCMQYYRKKGFPEQYGLYECTIIAVDIKNHASAVLLDKWWKEFLIRRTYRDQLSLPFIMWKNGYQYDDIGKLGDSIFEDCKITVYSHH